MSSDVKAKEIALREIEKLRQFIESGEVTFVVAFGKKDGRDFHFGGTTGEHRSPEAIMRLAEVMSGLAVDLNRSVKQPRSQHPEFEPARTGAK